VLELRLDGPTAPVETHSYVGRTSDPTGVAELASLLAERIGPTQLARLRRTALRPGQPLGSAEITHPFHPLRGQRFVVLKIKEVSGAEILSLRHAEMGSLAVRREWTDWAAPGTSREPISGQKLLLIDAPGLLALADLISSLKRKRTT
jgi:hypothetical protein